MKLKTKARVTFLSMILFPVALSIVAFLVMGAYFNKKDTLYGIAGNYDSVLDPFAAMGNATEEVYEEIVLEALNPKTRLEDKKFLEEENESIKKRASYIIVRKEDTIFYAGNELAAAKVFDRLPPYGSVNPETSAGVYYSDLGKFVRQIDFTFADGAQGSVFIVTRVNDTYSRQLILDMGIAILLILIFTALMVTKWIDRSVFDPINELNVGMNKIKEGNFDFVLATTGKGEIGELYQNYEDMRLRLKETTEEKMQQEAQNKELISNISHDLKTPITAVKGYVEGIMDGVADTPEKMDKYIRTIYNKANDMDRLINELTIYSKIDNNRIPYHFHRINVSEYFGDCVEEVGMDLEAKNIRLNYTNIVSPETKIIADPEQMKRVINNIIGNSVKYMDKTEGEIDIRILDEVDSIRVEIEDNGKGIAAKDLANIFDRFYRTDASRNSAQGGSGIGLSIVKKIIEDHGGYIWATGKEGEGTCIHFVLRKYEEKEGEHV